MVLVLKREVRIDRAVASGRTVDSINYKVQGSDLIINFDSTLGILDGGNRPDGSKPSVYSILQWMRDKNIRPRDSRKSDSTKGRFVSTSRRNLISSAFLIARAIKDNGTIKRFGYRGTNVLDSIGILSNLGQEMINEMKESLFNDFNLIFEQK